MSPSTLAEWGKYVFEQPLLCTLFLMMLIQVRKLHQDNVTRMERHHAEQMAALKDLLGAFSKLEHSINNVVSSIIRLDRPERYQR